MAEGPAKSGARKQRGNSAKVLPFRFKPGQCGNPNGRPKGTGLTARIRQALDEPDPKYGTKGDKLIAMAMEHANGGNFAYFRELIERTDGKVADKQEVTGAGGQALTFIIAEAKPPEAK